MTENTRWIGLVLFILVCLGAGGLGAIATTPEIESWYKAIEKPSWNPPDYVFGPVPGQLLYVFPNPTLSHARKCAETGKCVGLTSLYWVYVHNQSCRVGASASGTSG